jgi:hypothetical protein
MMAQEIKVVTAARHTAGVSKKSILKLSILVQILIQMPTTARIKIRISMLLWSSKINTRILLQSIRINAWTVLQRMRIGIRILS